MNKVLILALVAFVVLGAACGGSSDGGDPVDPGSGLNAEFLADMPNPGDDTVSAGEGGVGGNLVTVNINVTDTNGIYGASFDLTYDPSVMNYVGFDEGNLLEQQGSPFYDVQEPSNGHLVVVATLVGGVNGANASGTRTIVGLTFEAIQAGSSDLTFEAEALADDQGNVLPSIAWFGGALNANN